MPSVHVSWLLLCRTVSAARTEFHFRPVVHVRRTCSAGLGVSTKYLRPHPCNCNLATLISDISAIGQHSWTVPMGNTAREIFQYSISVLGFMQVFLNQTRNMNKCFMSISSVMNVLSQFKTSIQNTKRKYQTRISSLRYVGRRFYTGNSVTRMISVRVWKATQSHTCNWRMQQFAKTSCTTVRMPTFLPPPSTAHCSMTVQNVDVNRAASV